MPNTPAITDPAFGEFQLEGGLKAFLQELVNSAAVKIECKNRRDRIENTVYEDGIMRTAAILLSLHHGVSVNEIEDEAERRAKEIYRTGQDWRREVRLFNSHVNFNQD